VNLRPNVPGSAYSTKFLSTGREITPIKTSGICDTSPMLPTLHDIAQARRGESLVLGSLVHSRPWFPSRAERAKLVRHHLPTWAVASGITAGWVWTGMGSPEPWCVLREEKPGISPLDRVQWRARIRGAHHTVMHVSGLPIVSPRCTVKELLRGEGEIDVCATQIMMLSGWSTDKLSAVWQNNRSTSSQQDHQALVLHRLAYLRARYPDITR